MDGTTVIVVALALSGFIWKLIDGVKAMVGPDKVPNFAWVIAAFVAGVFLAIVFDVNLFSQFGQGTSLQHTTGQVMSGLAMGAGAGFIHDVVDR